MIWFRILLLVAIAGVGFHFGAPIPVHDQWPLFEALRTTTSIVFGVIAALLALVYPDTVKNALRGGAPASSADGGLSRLLSACGHSAMLLLLLVVIAPLLAWLATIKETASPDLAFEIRRGSFAIFCVLSYWQVRILLMVLLPFDALYSKVSQDLQRERLRRDLHRNGRS